MSFSSSQSSSSGPDVDSCRPKRLAARRAQRSILCNSEQGDIKKALRESLLEAQKKAENDRRVGELLGDSSCSETSTPSKEGTRPKRQAAKRAQTFLQEKNSILYSSEQSDIEKALRESLLEAQRQAESNQRIEEILSSTCSETSSSTSEKGDTRPKRQAAKRAQSFLYEKSAVLSSSEKNDIKKAVRESLLELRKQAENKKIEDLLGSSVSEPSNSTTKTDEPKAKKSAGNKRAQNSIVFSPEQNDIKKAIVDMQTSTASCPFRKTKIPAQRKFAQGSLNNTPTSTPNKSKSKNITQVAELFAMHRPTAEDFLTFLCFWKTKLLPPHLDLFALNGISRNKDLSDPES
ncbi:uncharacterized protein LOC141852267 isoform X2 [Brevipalpus obovatus]|uniref:uncharacterized protein LOC141852267 isoform X2 n=1 Tax=Brevipalpus obovatus TaxID=246614 RepID=UPI003D9EBB8F